MTDSINELNSSMQILSLISIIMMLLCIIVAWWALQVFRFDALCRDPRGVQARLLQILLAIAIGYPVAKFIMEYVQWTLQLKGMF